MAFDFPNAPSANDEYTSGGVTYLWTGTTWDLKPAATGEFVKLTGDTMTGALQVPVQVKQGVIIPGAQVVAPQEVTSAKYITDNYLDLAGGAMRGELLLLAADPLTPETAAHKKYVDSKASGATMGDVKQGLQMADHAGWILLNGRAVSTLTATQQAEAAKFGFTANLPNGVGCVPYMPSLGATPGSVAGNNAKTITQANLPNVTLTSSQASSNAATTSISGNHQHAAYGRTSDANSCTFYDWPEIGGQYRWNNGETHVGNKSTSANYESTKYPLAAGGEHNHTVTLPVHTHTIPLGGSGTTLDCTPKNITLNYFCYLGA